MLNEDYDYPLNSKSYNKGDIIEVEETSIFDKSFMKYSKNRFDFIPKNIAKIINNNKV